MLTHLYSTYERITEGYLGENSNRMKHSWDPNQPFEVLIDQLEYTINYVAAGNTPYTK